MADFNDLRKQLNTSRKEAQASKQNLFLARERLRQAERELQQLERSFNNENANDVARRNALNNKISSEKETIASLQNQYKQHLVTEASIYERFKPFADPRELIGNLSDSRPILLFPLRIETRFKQVEQDETTVNELWVRIYPDDCMINTFESVPSQMELDNTEFYWSTWWQAGGVEEQQRGAWRTLVSSHGSGRSKWLIHKHRPENVSEEPVKSNPEDVILVIPVYEYPPASERDAILTYWHDIWKAGTNTQKQVAAQNALIAVVGKERALEIQEHLAPDNIQTKPAGSISREETNIQAIFLKFPQRSTVESKLDSWSQAPRVDNMPERFVVTGYQGGENVFEIIGNPVPSPLYTGPDPSLADDQKLQKKEGLLHFDAGMKWMVDFDEAIRVGMGFKIRLSPEQAKRGFDKITVLGIRMSADPGEGAEILSSLITDHSNSRKGFEVLPQGTTTNNTDEEGSDYLGSDDPDRSFNELKEEKNFEPTEKQHEKADGQLLAEYLGLNPDTFQNVTGSGLFDQRDAWAMNTALWPATLGYMMESLMHPVFSDEMIEETREFFTQYVSGRGTIPAVRIGRQPYGILPATRFNDMRWFKSARRTHHAEHVMTHLTVLSASYLEKLYAVLYQIDQDWESHLDKVSYVGKSGDAHQLLLDILGLNPVSVDFFRRYAESVQTLYNRLIYYSFVSSGDESVIPGDYLSSGINLLRNFGYKGDEVPKILDKLFIKDQDKMSSFLIDDRPVSESEKIRNYMPEGEPPRNYIQWLIDAVKQNHDELRKQDGFKDNRPPAALLYLMLHHALDLSYVEVSLQLHKTAEIMDTDQVRQARIDPVFLHVQQKKESTESKWQYLYKSDQRITGNNSQQIGDYIPQLLGDFERPAAYMSRMIKAMEHLKDASTARLERAFTEHIDCCTYRLDAWKNGFMKVQLQTMRYTGSEEENTMDVRPGIYLGAFGYLENVRPEHKAMKPAELEDALKGYFESDGEGRPTLMKDDTNQGYIMAPSLNHAVTAAVLRNGYTANAAPSNPETLKVNLSSERVRRAIGIIEGIRGGQSLGALLGYHLERGLHENHTGIELDYYIYQLRKAFPLRGNRMRSTYEEEAAAEVIDARNVVDGLSLIKHIQETNNRHYPFGKSLEPADNQSQQKAIDQEVNHIMDLNDAIADVAIAESVHQIVQGNYDRGAATLDTFSKGHFPPIPDVIQTPRSGINITHRFGLHFPTGLNHTTSPLPAMSMTPRAMAEPAINKWLSGVLPHPDTVACHVEYYDFTNELYESKNITQTELGLQPLDMIYFVDTQNNQAMSSLDDRIMSYLLGSTTIRPDADIQINYTQSIPGSINLFELNPLLNNLRNLILQSRPLEANDVARPTEVNLQKKTIQKVDLTRFQDALSIANSRLATLNGILSPLKPLLEDAETNRATLIAQIDSLITSASSAVINLADYLPEQAGTGFAYGWKANTYAAIVAKIQDLIDRWQARLTKFQEYIDEYNALDPSASRSKKEQLLQGAERQVTTEPTYPLPTDLNAFVADLNSKRTNFNNKLQTFQNSLNSNILTIYGLLSDIRPKLDYSRFDNEKTDLTDIEEKILFFISDLYDKLKKLSTNLNTRFSMAGNLISALTPDTDPSQKIKNIQAAAKQLFGDDFIVVPEFKVQGPPADEWQNAYDDRERLLSYSAPSETNFPVDDWMHGVARVRNKMKHWESLVFLTEAFETNNQPLHPLQLPYKPDDSWVAIEFPKDYEIDNDRILYTAHYARPFNKSEFQCGLLMDEWTEVVPSREETAGIAFHYDKPNSEPPQAMLLAMPSDFRGEWQWEDLVDTLHDTFAQAKKRAVEPDHIDDTSYGWYLPAVISSVNVHRLAPSLNLALAETKLFKYIDLTEKET